MQGGLISKFVAYLTLGSVVLLPIVVAGLERPSHIMAQERTADAEQCEYWVAPAGDNNNAGSKDEPWATLEHAAANVPDEYCTVWFADGIYEGNNRLTVRFDTPTLFKSVHPYQAVLENSGSVIKLDGVKNVIFDGFEMRHSGPDAGTFIVVADRRGEVWAEYVTLRNNIIHDSYNDDLLKIYNGARFFTIENNVFYNQGESEQHIDANSVTDVLIQDNIFFNDFAGSGRNNDNSTKHFIVIKDSQISDDGLEGSERVSVRRNVFLNWEGGTETFIKIGNDGRPYYEAENVRIENNLILGNSANLISTALGISGSKNVTFANNTVVGDMPSTAFAFRLDMKGENPPNENIFFYNNIWSDPTGSMGANPQGGFDDFADGAPEATHNLVLDNNLYWNGSDPIPASGSVTPLVDDVNLIIADPKLNENQADIILPRWRETAFLSGNSTIRQEFLRLVERYGQVAIDSAAINQANPELAPIDDILGCARVGTPAVGVSEVYRYAYSAAKGETQVDAKLLNCDGRFIVPKAHKYDE